MTVGPLPELVEGSLPVLSSLPPPPPSSSRVGGDRRRDCGGAASGGNYSTHKGRKTKKGFLCGPPPPRRASNSSYQLFKALFVDSGNKLRSVWETINEFFRNFLFASLFSALCFGVLLWVFKLKLPLWTLKFENMLKTEDFERPVDDLREFRYVPSLFPGGPSHLSIQDFSSDEAGIGISIDSGSFKDPDDVPGLAHLTEHMLFLASKKYPEVSSLDDFLSAHGGNSNAFTTGDQTVLFASVSAPWFSETLDRLGSALDSPLLTEDLAVLEAHSVDAEHGNNVAKPEWRVMRAVESQADPPLSRFATGSLESLQVDNPKYLENKLKKYFSEFCPQNMNLVTIGPIGAEQQTLLPLQSFHYQIYMASLILGSFESLRKMSENCIKKARKTNDVEEKLDKSDGKFRFSSFGKPGSLGNLLLVEAPEGAQPELWLVFGLPPRDPIPPSLPSEYLRYMLTYGGKGSLMHTLESSSLASALSFSLDSSSECTEAVLRVGLTYKGKEEWRLVTRIILRFIQKMREQDVDKKIFRGVQMLTKLRFHTDERSSDSAEEASELAEILGSPWAPPPEKVLARGRLVENLNPAPLRNILRYLTVEHLNVALYVSSSPSASSAREYGQVIEDPFYHFKYQKRQFSREELDLWEAQEEGDLTRQLRLPPSVLDFGGVALLPPVPSLRPLPAPPLSELEAPPRLLRMPGGEGWSLWHRPSSLASTLPKAEIFMRLTYPSGKGVYSAEDGVLSSLLWGSVNSELQLVLSPFTAAGYAFSLWQEDNGLHIRVKGWAQTEAMREILKRGLEIVQSPSSALGLHLPRVLSELSLSLSNEEIDDALGYAKDDLLYSLLSTTSTVQDRIAFLNEKVRRVKQEKLARLKLSDEEAKKVGLTEAEREEAFPASEILKFHESLWEGHLDMYFSGMWKAEDSLSLAQEIKQSLNLKKYFNPSRSAFFEPRATNFNGPVEVRTHHKNSASENFALLNAYLLPSLLSPESRLIFGLLGEMLDRKIYDFLRTKKQLGYIASAGASMEPHSSGVGVLLIRVEGGRVQPDEMDRLVEITLDQFKPEDLTNAEIRSWVAGKLSDLSDPPRSSEEESLPFWHEIEDGSFCFNYREIQRDFLKSSPLSKIRGMLVRSFEECCKAGRQKLGVKLWPQSVIIPQRNSDMDFLYPGTEGGASKGGDESLPPPLASFLKSESENTVWIESGKEAERLKLLRATKASYFPPSALQCQSRKRGGGVLRIE